MRLLVVSYWYTPAVSPRAFRWTALAEHWAAQGHHVDVVAAWAPGFRRDEVLNGVHVHRVGSNVRASARGWLRRRRRTDGAPSVDTRTSAARASVGDRPLPARLVRWVYDHTWKKVYWPDDAGPWFFAARKEALRLASSGEYDAVVSVSHPFTCHLVGEAVHRRFPDLRWVMDVGDPFSFLERTPTNNHALYRSLNYRVERRVFRDAHAVAVTTEPTRRIYGELFPESGGKVRVVPPLLPELDRVPAFPPVFAEDDRIRLVFSGNLYRTIREPGFLLRIFAALRETPVGDRVQLHFFGNVRDCWSSFEPYREWIDRSIFLHGTVHREHALRAMRESAALVNLGNDTLYQLPSKVLEYVALAKPVLNLVTSERDSSAAFFRSYPAALTLVDRGSGPSVDEVERVVRLVQRTEAPDAARLSGWLDEYRLGAVAAGYEALLAGHASAPPREAPSARDRTVAAG